MTNNPNELTIENSVLVLIDHQPAVAINVRSINLGLLVNNVAALSQVAKAFGVPTVLTTVGAQGSVLVDPLFKEITEAFPDNTPIDRTGDAAYNDVHLYLAESNAQTRQEWIAALDQIESLNPRAVVASHKRPENDDNPRIIEQTRQYIRDFDRLAASTTTAQDLYKKMLELYPNRVNPGWALWSSARAVKPLNPEVVACAACASDRRGQGHSLRKLGVESIDLWQLHHIDRGYRATNSSAPCVNCGTTASSAIGGIGDHSGGSVREDR